MFFAFLLLAGFAGCKSNEAHRMDVLLDTTENIVFGILVKYDEEPRLRALVNRDGQQALTIAQKQYDSIQSVINNIAKLDIEKFEGGDVIKKETINYYQALAELKACDIVEARQIDSAKAGMTATGILDLNVKRLEIHNKISQIDQKRHNARLHFKESNIH